MRVASSLTLPDDLERARASGELVVFAGAGVSMGPPANLPSFVALAREIADPPITFRPAEDEEALDGYLGRAERAKVKVQERARERLIARGGTHTPLHEHLLGIFGEPSLARLITTNFDTHFNTAVETVFAGARIPQYVGPALPPGRSFRGIVQLHGSLSQNQDRLVLTKPDFAAAYMTDGWAARFLVGAFADRSVLFVGYSLGDPVMQYLLSALPSSGRWYALCHEDDQARWADHDVKPVPFSTGSGGDRFADLNAGLQRWHWYAKASPVDHDRELRRLVTLGPAVSPQEVDYVRARLRTETGRVTFWAAATDPAWFAWVVGEKLLDVLFNEHANPEDVDPWARWCLANFNSGENPLLLQFCRRTGVRPNAVFALELALTLWRTDPLPPRAVLRQMLALVINQSDWSTPRSDHYTWLLDKLVKARFGEEALALLRWLTKVRLEPLERLHFAFETEDTGPDPDLRPLANRISTHAAPDDLDHFLQTQGDELAAMSGNGLLALGEARLTEAYELLELARGSETSSFDWLSYGRTAIAATNQDPIAHGEDVLVALVRVVLERWRKDAPDRLKEFAGRYVRDRRRLLKRLALYALAESKAVVPDEVLAQAASERWAGDFWVRPELYRVLKAHYDGAAEEAKALFVGSLRDVATWTVVDEDQSHARFSLSQLLIQLSPRSESTKALAKEEAAAHPDWQQQDPDGFLTRTEVGWGGEGPSPITAEQMISLTPAEALERVVIELDKTDQLTGPSSLLGAVQQAVKAKPTWGVGLLDAGAVRNAPQPLIEAALWGLREATGTADDKLTVLRLVASWNWPDAVTHALSSMLDHWARDLKQADPALLNAFDAAADQVFVRGRGEPSGIGGERGWTERAINHPSGHAASIWWRVANARDLVDGQFVLTIDDAERARWERVLTDTTASGAYGRVILAMASDRLAAGDYPWAERVVFPAFDPQTGEERAAQLWDGRIGNRRWSWTTIGGLRPYIPSFLQKSADLVPARSRDLGDWIAMLITHTTESQFTVAELQRFVQHATVEARRVFAEVLPAHLDQLDPDARRKVWQDVLRPFWRDRRTNVPVALDVEEVAMMIGWVVSLPEVADEALAELIQTDGQALPHADRIMWKWRQEGDWIRAHPREAIGLVRWLAERKSIEPWVADDAVKVLERALEAGAPRSDVLEAAEVLAGIPCQRAIELAERLRK